MCFRTIETGFMQAILTIKNLIFLTTLFLLTANIGKAQTYEMDVEDGNTIYTCSGTFTDSDPSITGDYLNDEDYTVTFCSGSSEFLTFDFDVTGFFDALGTGDTLYMYDGMDVTGDLIMKIDNTDDPGFSEFMLSTFSTCVTFRFISDGAGTNDGWAAEISCPAPPESCSDNPVAADIALQAPYICNFDGYCGNTSAYYHEDLPNNMIGTGGSCPSAQAFLGTIQNNSWLRFEATATSVSLDFTVSGCGLDGIQVGILQYDGSDWVRFSDCDMTDGENSGTFTVDGTGMTIGEVYYIMVDGFAGANCDYIINVEDGDGIAVLDAGADQTVCPGSDVDLTATGPLLAEYTWHSLDGVITDAIGASQTFNPLVETIYVVEITGGGVCQSQTDTVVVFMGDGADPGVGGSVLYCAADDPVDLFLELTGTPDAGGDWSPALISGTGEFDPAADLAGTYTYTLTSVCGESSSEIIVTIDDAIPNVGADSTITICGTDDSFDLTTQLGGTPEPGGIWTPSLISGTSIFDPVVDPAGEYTYSLTNACGTNTATVTIAIDVSIPNAGTSGSLTTCITDDPADLFLELTGTPDFGGEWSPVMDSGTGFFNPGVDSDGTYTYTLSNACGSASSEVVTTVVDGLPNTGDDGDVLLCIEDDPINLFSELTGGPEMGGVWSPIMDSGTDLFNPAVDVFGEYTYSLTNVCGTANSIVTTVLTESPNAGTDNETSICPADEPINLFDLLGGTPDIGGIWTPELASGTGEFDPTIDLADTYTYTLETACGTAVSEVIITLNPLPNAGLDATISMCSDEDPFNLIDSLGGSPELGGIWEPALTSGSDLFDPTTDTELLYQYNVTNTCGSTSAEIIIDIISLPLAGENGTLSICTNAEPYTLTSSIEGEFDSGGLWSPELTAGEEFNPSIDTPGVYTYTVSNVCGSSSSTVIVSTNDLPNAGESAILTICPNDTPINLFDSIEGSPTEGGTWTPVLYSGTNFYSPNQDELGLYTYTVSNECGENSTVVQVTDFGADCSYHIYIPTVFSPNNDGENDGFYIRGSGITEMTLTIYNRWGQKVFQSTNQEIGWDGYFRGKPVNNDVFVYLVYGTYQNGETFNLTGDVTLTK